MTAVGEAVISCTEFLKAVLPPYAGLYAEKPLSHEDQYRTGRIVTLQR